MLTKPSLTLKRRINATPEKVYDAWTDPKKIAGWFGPDGTEVERTEADVQVDGRYCFVLRDSDCDEHEVSGVYREVVPNKKLVFTWAWKGRPEQVSLVTVLFKRDGKGTILTLTHEQLPDDSARDQHRGGWSGSLDKLEELYA